MVTFYDHLDGRGTNSIRKWVADQSDREREAVRAALDAAVVYLQTTPPAQWSSKRWYPMHGKGWGAIYEVRFQIAEAKNVQFRVFSVYGPNRSQVTLLYGYVKPRDALPDPRWVQARRQEIERDPTRIQRHFDA